LEVSGVETLWTRQSQEVQLASALTTEQVARLLEEQLKRNSTEGGDVLSAMIIMIRNGCPSHGGFTDEEIAETYKR